MRRDTLTRSWAYAAMGTLALLILVGGMCCLDHDGAAAGDMDHHAVSMGLCSAMVISPSGLWSGAMLLLLGLIPNLRREAFAVIPLSVPKPPPRLARSS
jgi:hypothetical protein